MCCIEVDPGRPLAALPLIDLPTAIEGIDMKLPLFASRVATRALIILLGIGGLPMAAHAQADYPSRTITMVMPYPPGGLADAASRRLAARLTEMWKVSVVVDSKPGAAGSRAESCPVIANQK